MDFKTLRGFGELEAEIARKRGGFFLFALFLRDGAPDRWDLLVSAPWIDANRSDAVSYLAEEIKQRLGLEALILLSKIVVVDHDHPDVDEFLRSVQVEHGSHELRDRTLFGQPVKLAYVITSRHPLEPKRATA